MATRQFRSASFQYETKFLYEMQADAAWVPFMVKGTRSADNVMLTTASAESI